jgi:hypothetical protein
MKTTEANPRVGKFVQELYNLCRILQGGVVVTLPESQLAG